MDGAMSVMAKVSAALFRLLAALCLVQGMAASPAAAQSSPTIGWISGHTSEHFAGPDAACRSQWAYYMGTNGGSKYIGAFPRPGRPDIYDCNWTSFMRGCDGGISWCWTVLPAWVWLLCDTGYSPETGICQKDSIPECPTCRNNGSSDNPAIGHPIVLSTGAKILHAQDYASGDGDFVIGRSYRSNQIGRSASFQTPIRGLAGGWNFDFAYELQLASFSGSPSSPNAKLALVNPNGTASDFVMQGGGTWVPDTTTGAFYADRNVKIEYVGTLPSDLSTLQSASTQWKVTDGEDTVWTFQTFVRPNTTTPYAVGRPISRVTRDGYAWTFAYRSDNSLQTITDSFGRQATFNWSTFYMTSQASSAFPFLPWPEAVTSVALPDGTSLRYTYDPPPATSAPSSGLIERLIKSERLNASSVAIDSTTYAYGDSRFPHHITAITDFDGTQTASYAYDAEGRGISTALASGADSYQVSNSETSTERIRTVTRPLGKIAEYHFAKYGGNSRDIRLTSVVEQNSANTPASTASTTYDANAFIATQTDPEGRVTSYTRDSRDRPTTIVEAYGTPQARTTTITWHSTLNVPTQIVQPGLQTDYTYSTSGQLLTSTETDTTSQSVPYSTNGQTRTTTYTWGSGGRLASLNGPKPVDGAGKDDTFTYAYDTFGNLQTVTNGLGQATSFANYDASGRPRTMTDTNGIVTAFTYDTLGRTSSVTVRHPSNSSLDAVTTFTYDIHHRVTGVTAPSTDKLFMDYDTAGRLTAIRAASGERIDYTVDSGGNVTAEKTKRADTSTVQTVSRTFDELGRTLTETLGPGRTTKWAYDKVDNPTTVTSARNLATQAAFDPLNRLVSTVAPDTGTTATAYNAIDAVTSHTDAISVQTTFIRDGFGEVIQEVSPDRGTSTYYYNEAGELTASIDGCGQRVDYTRDILGRVTSKTPQGHSGEAVTYNYDTAGISGSYGVGRLSSMTDASGTASFAYDHRGNLITKRQSLGGATADLTYTYDLADRIIQVAYPSGRLVAYGRDSKGRVTSVQTKASASDPSWTMLASGLTYEPWGSLTAATFGNGLSLAQTWIDGRLATKRLYNTSTSANLSSLAYAYDADDNIGAIRDLVDDSKSSYYGFDPNSRLAFASMTVETPVSGTESYSYTSGKNRLASVTNAAGTRSISNDGRGNTSSEARPGSVSVSTSYDGYGRLLGYTRTGDPAQANAYNGLDERVSVTSASTTHNFVYDADHRLIGEYDSSGAPVAETIWLSPSVGGGSEPFGGDDGIGGYAPLALVTDAGGSAAIYWIHASHIGVPLVTTNASGAVATPTGYTMLGFPGQTRTLADLYYNRYRDYDSSLGRYIQADPIGLRGGDNPYLYAGANPLKYADPFGLSPTTGLVIEVAWDWWWKRQLRPARNTPWGRAWGIGEAIGTTLGVIKFIYEQHCKEKEEERAKRCDENLERDLETCRAMGNRDGKSAYAICKEQAYLRYGNCLAGRDGPRGINAPLPPWGTRYVRR
jgi:RHS repeat-associated protein